MAVEVEDFYKDLGLKVRALRSRQHFTQQQLGSLLTPQVTRASIANIETGKQRVLAHTLIQLAAALRVSVEELLPRVRAGGIAHIQEELSHKLALPNRQIDRLAQRLAKPTSETRSLDERSRRTRRR